MADPNDRERGLEPHLEVRLGAWVGAYAAWLGILGGFLLIVITLLTVVSVVGRSLLGAPVEGDFELVSAGCAIAVFAFLPWCQYRRGHVTVDVFFMRASPRTIALTSLVGNILMTAAAALIAWRLQAGMMDKAAYLETSFILRLPVWWGYAGSLVGAWSFALVSLYTVWRSFTEWMGRGEHLFAAGSA
jgi:TRAP-type C4-dicarboxylate transport system permease small subunit